MIPTAAARSGLVTLTRAALNPPPGASARKGGEPPWEQLLPLAERHDLIPLLRAGAVRCGLAIPPAVAAVLQKTSLAWELRHEPEQRQLEELLLALNAAGVVPVLLKGAALARRYYPSPGLRPFGDLDLLVRGEDRDTADGVMAPLGYRDVEYRSGRTREELARDFYHWAYARPRSLKVELHWALTSPGSAIRLDLPGLVSRATPLHVGAGTARGLAPEDEAVYLAVHVVRHQFRVPLRQYADLAALMAGAPDLDWRLAQARAEAALAGIDLDAFIRTAAALGFVELPAAFPAASSYGLDVPALADYAIAWPTFEDPAAMLDLTSTASALRRLSRMWTALRRRGVPSCEPQGPREPPLTSRAPRILHAVRYLATARNIRKQFRH